MLALGLVASIFGLMLLIVSISTRVLDQARLDALAENAAVAGANALRGLATGSPCESAREIVLSGEAEIISCSVIGGDLLLKLQGRGLKAKARAGE